MFKYLLSGAAVAGFVAIAPAIGQTPAPAPVVPQVQDRLGEPGWNGLGRSSIHTRAEVGTHVRTLFERLDTNRDGYITRAEVEARKGERRNRIEKRIERRGAAAGGHMFDRIDTNRDGVISRSEFEAAPMRHERRMVMRTDHDRDGRRDAMRGMRGMRGMPMGLGNLHGRMFDMADANRDGRVSLQEATNAAYRHFDTADVNRDGRLTPDERSQLRQRMRAERRRG
jgi:hypothetical protein